MRNILFILLLLAFATSICLAQNPAAPVKPVVSTAVVTKTLSGKVDSVTVADPAKGTKSEIVVIGDTGVKTALLVKTSTTIYDADWKAITLDKIQKDAMVKVKYATTKEGVNEATWISLLK